MSRLDAIKDWEDRARAAGYDLHVLARQVGVCGRQLRRHLAKRVGKPLQCWMDRLRLADAWPWLRAGKPVKHVAFLLGYKQPSHFSAAFKSAYGISPSACRLLPGTFNRPSKPDAPLAPPNSSASAKMSVTDTKCPPQIRVRACCRERTQI